MQNIVILPSIDQEAMPKFFFCQVYLCNGTKKRRRKKLKENVYIHILKKDSLPGSLGKQSFSVLYHKITGNVYSVYYCPVDLGKLLFWAIEINRECRTQNKEFSFPPISKAVKAVSFKTDFGVSAVIITFFVVGANWTLDSGMEVANCNAKPTKTFIAVAV